ncbi:hypothetical protein HPB51_021723 [Rhipicephalus microplus]|uniref:Uncharacterized protein n=1 Tax=Rhipicephalus microplus TaxID=6941 RepID=A0A9J6DQ82_RHIMP|nr:hypothetical protein HPB51_021723 [Rhipicephalus microplus]
MRGRLTPLQAALAHDTARVKEARAVSPRRFLRSPLTSRLLRLTPAHVRRQASALAHVRFDDAAKRQRAHNPRSEGHACFINDSRLPGHGRTRAGIEKKDGQPAGVAGTGISVACLLHPPVARASWCPEGSKERSRPHLPRCVRTLSRKSMVAASDCFFPMTSLHQRFRETAENSVLAVFERRGKTENTAWLTKTGCGSRCGSGMEAELLSTAAFTYLLSSSRKDSSKEIRERRFASRCFPGFLRCQGTATEKKASDLHDAATTKGVRAPDKVWEMTRVRRPQTGER